MNRSLARGTGDRQALGMSATRKWMSHTRFARVRARLEAFEPSPGWRN